MNHTRPAILSKVKPSRNPLTLTLTATLFYSPFDYPIWKIEMLFGMVKKITLNLVETQF